MGTSCVVWYYELHTKIMKFTSTPGIEAHMQLRLD